MLALSLLLVVSTTFEAAACERSYQTVEYLLPVADDVPLNGSMLAYIELPVPHLDASYISLRTLSGEQVAVEVEFEGGQATALASGWPLQPLEPHSTYIWSIGSWEHMFTTGDIVDVEPPTFSEVVVSYAGIETALGCFGQTFSWQEYELEVTGLDEPVAVYELLDPVHAVYDAPLTVGAPLAPEQDQCYELFLQDHGGNIVSTGTTCLGLVESGDGDGDGTDESGGMGESGGTDETGTMDGTDSDGGGIDISEEACACRADASASEGAALTLLLFSALRLGRRRRARP